jgi:hypothetical protein
MSGREFCGLSVGQSRIVQPKKSPGLTDVYPFALRKSGLMILELLEKKVELGTGFRVDRSLARSQPPNAGTTSSINPHVLFLHLPEHREQVGGSLTRYGLLTT